MVAWFKSLSEKSLWWWLVKPLYWWVVSRSTADSKLLPSNLNLRPKRPVLYVNPKNSIIDFLVMLHHCRKNGLPLPLKKLALSKPLKGAYYFSLRRTGMFQTKPRRMDSQILNLVAMAKLDNAFDVDIVPVSVFWGQNPGKDEKSYFKLLFNDDEFAGIFQKIFIVFAQGKNAIIHYGKAVHLRTLVEEGAATDQTSRKLHRLLRVHFRRMRNSVLGQKLYVRENVISGLMTTKNVRRVIQEQAKLTGQSVTSMETKSRHYATEISSDMTYSIVQMFKNFVGWLWGKIFVSYIVNNLSMVKNLVESDHEIIYVPTHRSHLDYLFLNYSLYSSGLPNPHTAAGLNLNFFPVGWFLRRGGAFFLRRSFGGNLLYTAVFQEYLQYLMSQGYPFTFFPEGGRSRTGFVLKLKLGIIGMIVRSYMKEHRKKVVLVPISIAYDRVLEVGSFFQELAGQKKRKESLRQLLGARNILKQYCGRSYLNFGEPIHLDRYLDKYMPNWRENPEQPLDDRNNANPLVQRLASKLAESMNACAVISPVSLLGMSLAGIKEKAATYDEVITNLNFLTRLAKANPGCRQTFMPFANAQEILEESERMNVFKRFAHPGGDVIHYGEMEALVLTYHRNNILHLFAIPALIARFFQFEFSFPRKALVVAAGKFLPFLKEEFFLSFNDEQGSTMIEGFIDHFIEVGVLQMNENDLLERPDRKSIAFRSLRNLGFSLSKVLERYSIAAILLTETPEGCEKDLDSFVADCCSINQRISILDGHYSPESRDKKLYVNFYRLLQKLGYLRQNGAKMIIDSKLENFSLTTRMLMNDDIEQSIERLAKGCFTNKDPNPANQQPTKKLSPTSGATLHP